MTQIQPGDLVTARTADGQFRRRRAITGVVDGLDFPVVWVCSPAEWDTAQAEGRQPEGLPWPAEDVEPAAERVQA
jgi:hypothetical protein